MCTDAVSSAGFQPRAETSETQAAGNAPILARVAVSGSAARGATVPNDSSSPMPRADPSHSVRRRLSKFPLFGTVPAGHRSSPSGPICEGDFPGTYGIDRYTYNQ